MVMVVMCKVIIIYEDDGISDDIRTVFNCAVVGGNHMMYGSLGIIPAATLWCVLWPASVVFSKIFIEDDGVTVSWTLAGNRFVLSRLSLVTWR